MNHVHESARIENPRDCGQRSRRGVCGSPGRFLGVEVESVNPKAQIALASVTLAPVLLSGLFLVVFVPELWWIFTTYGWVSFPAFGLLARGLSGVASAPSSKQKVYESAKSKEQELLEALRDHGELSPARAAVETSLTVTEADRILGELSREGHLEVRVREGGLFYALWDGGQSAESRRSALE